MTWIFIKYQFIKKNRMVQISTCFKYIIRYYDNDDIRPLGIMLPQMIAYVKCFNNNINDSNNNIKTIYFKANDNKLLKKYIQI